MRRAVLGKLSSSVRAQLRTPQRPCLVPLLVRANTSSSASGSTPEESDAKRLKSEIDKAASSGGDAIDFVKAELAAGGDASGSSAAAALGAGADSAASSTSSSTTNAAAKGDSDIASSGNGSDDGSSSGFFASLWRGIMSTDSSVSRSENSMPRSESTSSFSSDEGDIANNASDRAADVSSDHGIDGAKVVAAFEAGKLGFGFSAGGLLFPYYVGIISALQEGHVLTGEPAQMAGSSAGSLIAASYNAGLPMAVVEESMLRFAEDLRANGTRGRLGPLLREFLHEYMPQDAHERCSGSTHVGLTRVVPIWRPTMVSHFHSRDDLIEALLTSCHIPWYFDGRWVNTFRGHYCFDGGATNFMPRPPNVDVAVKVCCFHTKSLLAVKERARRLPYVSQALDVAISPDKFEEWPYDLQQVLKWALQASNREVSDNLIAKGKRDARTWMRLTGLDVVAASMAKKGQLPEPKEEQAVGAAVVGSGQASAAA